MSLTNTYLKKNFQKIALYENGSALAVVEFPLVTKDQYTVYNVYNDKDEHFVCVSLPNKDINGTDYVILKSNTSFSKRKYSSKLEIQNVFVRARAEDPGFEYIINLEIPNAKIDPRYFQYNTILSSNIDPDKFFNLLPKLDSSLALVSKYGDTPMQTQFEKALNSFKAVVSRGR